MNLHLNKTVRIRLAITLFLLAVVTGLSAIANPTLGGTSGTGIAGTASLVETTPKTSLKSQFPSWR